MMFLVCGAVEAGSSVNEDGGSRSSPTLAYLVRGSIHGGYTAFAYLNVLRKTTYIISIAKIGEIAGRGIAGPGGRLCF